MLVVRRSWADLILKFHEISCHVRAQALRLTAQPPPGAAHSAARRTAQLGMCFWIHEPTGRVSQNFGSIAAAWAAPGPWQPYHPMHQPGWVLDGRGCEVWLAAVALTRATTAACSSCCARQRSASDG
jgi:hypothetical protein